MEERASRRPLSHRMRLGTLAAVVAASAIFVSNAALAQSGVIVDETVPDQLGPAKRGAPQSPAAPRMGAIRTEFLPSTPPKPAELPAAIQRRDIGVKPSGNRRAALKDPPTTMPRSRFLAPHLVPAEPKAARRKQTASTAGKRSPVVKPPRIIPPAAVTAPATPTIAKPTPPKPPARPRQETPAEAMPAIAPPPPPTIAAPGGAMPPKQLASLPAARSGEAQVKPSGDLYRLPFTGEAAALDERNSKLLDKLADRLKRDTSLRLQVLGFADSSESTSQARRVSLFRALAVRTYLMKQGVASTRMDVRALGSRNDDAPPNRVDVEIKK